MRENPSEISLASRICKVTQSSLLWLSVIERYLEFMTSIIWHRHCGSHDHTTKGWRYSHACETSSSLWESETSEDPRRKLFFKGICFLWEKKSFTFPLLSFFDYMLVFKIQVYSCYLNITDIFKIFFNDWTFSKHIYCTISKSVVVNLYHVGQAHLKKRYGLGWKRGLAVVFAFDFDPNST